MGFGRVRAYACNSWVVKDEMTGGYVLTVEGMVDREDRVSALCLSAAVDYRYLA
jgi:hypothetical protein